MTKNGIRIVGTGRALPKKRVSNEDLSRIVETSDEWIVSRTGIKNRYQCEEETCTTLAVEAAKRAVENADIDPKEIGIVIVATTTPEYAFPSTACLVQQALELGEEVTAFDMEAACTGFLLGLGIVRGLLPNIRKKYALMIGSEELSRILDYEDRSSCILFGDGAGAAVVELSEKMFIQKTWCRGDRDVLFCEGVGNDGAKLRMKGNEVFRFAVSALEQAMVETLREAALSMEDVDLVICHQANERIIRHIQRKYPEHGDKFYINIEKYGNTSAASIPIVLDELREKELLHSGMKLLCVGFGAGLTYSGALIEI